MKSRIKSKWWVILLCFTYFWMVCCSSKKNFVKCGKARHVFIIQSCHGYREPTCFGILFFLFSFVLNYETKKIKLKLVYRFIETATYTITFFNFIITHWICVPILKFDDFGMFTGTYYHPFHFQSLFQRVQILYVRNRNSERSILDGVPHKCIRPALLWCWWKYEALSLWIIWNVSENKFKSWPSMLNVSCSLNVWCPFIVLVYGKYMW